MSPSVFVNYATLEWLGASQNYDELSITVTSESGDSTSLPNTLSSTKLPTEEWVKEIAAQVRDKVEKSGRTVYFTWLPVPGQHPADETIQPLLLIMGVLGALSLGLAGFLVVNTISSLMMQQIGQIGIMKAVGARRRQIMSMYFGMVLTFGVLALLVAIPAALLGTRAVCGLYGPAHQL